MRLHRLDFLLRVRGCGHGLGVSLTGKTQLQILERPRTLPAAKRHRVSALRSCRPPVLCTCRAYVLRHVCSHAMHASGGPSPWQSCGGLAWDSSDEGCEPQKECMNQLCRHWHSAAQHSFVKALKRVKRRASRLVGSGSTCAPRAQQA